MNRREAVDAATQLLRATFKCCVDDPSIALEHRAMDQVQVKARRGAQGQPLVLDFQGGLTTKQQHRVKELAAQQQQAQRLAQQQAKERQRTGQKQLQGRGSAAVKKRKSVGGEQGSRKKGRGHGA